MSNRIALGYYQGSYSTVFNQLSLCLVLAACSSGLSAQDAPTHTNWPGPGQLFVGTCYQPVDRSSEQIDRDIAIMKRAGFNVVRMGDLSWDSFEPSRGNFELNGSTRSWTRCMPTESG